LLSGAPNSGERLTKVPEIWLNAPFNELKEFLGHYLRSKLLHPHLRAVVVVPKWRAKPWFKLLRNFRLVDEQAATKHVFTCPTNGGIEGRRQDVGPTRWTTQVYVDDTDRVGFLPQNLQKPPKTSWTHSTTLVTDGRRVLLAKEDVGMVWFPGGKHEMEDVTPECRAVRALTETTGLKMSETNLRLLETESSGQNKRYVYIARVRPGSIPNATSTSRALWATWKELISARRTGYFVRGDQ
jgi:ADP-ribose pyrophosphatase YjhB (NUDIX family)